MTVRSFAIGLTLAFGIAWASVVVVPFFLMRDVKPVAFDEAADGKHQPAHSGSRQRTVGARPNSMWPRESSGRYRRDRLHERA